MSVLLCDICDGRLVISSGGVAICEICGIEHDRERIREKVQGQKICLDVKVPITNSYKQNDYSDSSDIESLMKKGKIALEESKWKQAEDYFNKILNKNNKNFAPAMIGLLCVNLKLRNESELTNCRVLIENKHQFQEALRCADAVYRAKLFGYNQDNIENFGIYKSIKEEEKKNLNLENKTRKERLDITYNDFTELIKLNKDCIAAGVSHIVGLKSNCTVVSAGCNKYGQCDVTNWTEIIAISTRYNHTVALKKDGTVIAVGNNEYYQCNVEDWNDIISISAGFDHTVGLNTDGTVEATGNNKFGQCDIEYWKNIVSLSAGRDHTVGLLSDGSVVATGDNRYGQCNVKSWHDIIEISAGELHTIGLRSDGSVVAIGYNEYYQCAVDEWIDIVSISAGSDFTAGLNKEGKVILAGINDLITGVIDSLEITNRLGFVVSELNSENDNETIDDKYDENEEILLEYEEWEDIVALVSSFSLLLGLKADGTVVSIGDNENLKTDDWVDIGKKIISKSNISIDNIINSYQHDNENELLMSNILCDICNGKLIMGSGGIAICDTCGMEYNRERIREKVQGQKKLLNDNEPIMNSFKQNNFSNNSDIESIMKIKKAIDWSKDHLCWHCGGKMSFWSGTCKACKKSSLECFLCGEKRKLDQILYCPYCNFDYVKKAFL
jgi:alpha-tubulin suppressor-like RCC1 family protein